MRRSPLYSGKALAFVLTLLALAIGTWSLAPVAAPAAVSVAQMREHHTHRPMHARHVLRWQDGRVSDGDGWIGNGSWGADRAPHRHMNVPRRMPGRAASKQSMTLDRIEGARPCAQMGVGVLPDAANRGGNQMNENSNAGRAGSALGRAADDVRDGVRRAADELMPHQGKDIAPGDSVQDGTVDPGHASDGDVTDRGETPSTTQAPSEGETRTEESMGGVLPWVITALVVLAVVLVVLALVPKKKRSH